MPRLDPGEPGSSSPCYWRPASWGWKSWPQTPQVIGPGAYCLDRIQNDRVVRRGYNREVDAYISQLGARLRRRSTRAQRRNGHEPKLEDEVIRLREWAPSFEQVVGEAAALLQEADREPSGRLPPTRTAGTQTFTLSHRLHIAPG
jgi:hypothetical protein